MVSEKEWNLPMVAGCLPLDVQKEEKDSLFLTRKGIKLNIYFILK
jgi:hypothetical protein